MQDIIGNTMKFLTLATLSLISFAAFAANEERIQKTFDKPQYGGVSYLASTAEEIVGVPEAQKKRAKAFCISQNFDGVSDYDVKAISTVKYVKPKNGDRPFFKRLAPVELASFETGITMIKQYSTTHTVVSSYRDPIYLKNVTCFKKKN
jgi:hypothetical protein